MIQPVQVQEFGGPRRLRVGDVFRHAARLVVVSYVNESAATVLPLVLRQSSARVFNRAEGTVVEVKRRFPERAAYVSVRSEVDIVARLGADWRRNNFAAEVPGFASEQDSQAQTSNNEREDSMKKHTPARGGLAAAARETNSGAKTKGGKKGGGKRAASDSKPRAEFMDKLFDGSWTKAEIVDKTLKHFGIPESDRKRVAKQASDRPFHIRKAAKAAGDAKWADAAKWKEAEKPAEAAKEEAKS